MSLTDEEIAKLEEVSNLFRMRRTALQMLRDRGYSVDEGDGSEIKMTKQQFIERFGMNVERKDLFIRTHKRDDPSIQIFVLFPEVQKKVGCSIIKDCIVRMHAEHVSRAILVAQQTLTPQAKSVVSEVSGKYQIELFQDAELLVNISEHELVPKHEVLTTREVEDLFKKYKVKSTQLPRMLLNDPIARYFGLKLGQVVRIRRPSETAGTYITYRCIV